MAVTKALEHLRQYRSAQGYASKYGHSIKLEWNGHRFVCTIDGVEREFRAEVNGNYAVELFDVKDKYCILVAHKFNYANKTFTMYELDYKATYDEVGKMVDECTCDELYHAARALTNIKV